MNIRRVAFKSRLDRILFLRGDTASVNRVNPDGDEPAMGFRGGYRKRLIRIEKNIVDSSVWTGRKT